MGSVLNSDEVNTLQYAYSDSFGFRCGTYLGSIIRTFVKIWNPSIESESLREAIMALSCTFPTNNWIKAYDAKEYHCDRVGHVIARKTEASIDISDLFAVFLLIIVQCLCNESSKVKTHLAGFLTVWKILGRDRRLDLKSGNERIPVYSDKSFSLLLSLAHDIIIELTRHVANSNEFMLDFCTNLGPVDYISRYIYHDKLALDVPSRSGIIALFCVVYSETRYFAKPLDSRSGRLLVH